MDKIAPKSFYDVIIIGGGISGLSSAALFLRAGLSCCVIEKHSIPGGYLQGFDRGTFRFDSAIHWLNSCGTDGFVSRIFNIIGQDYPKAKTQKRIRRFVSHDFDYLLSNKPDELRDQWIAEFPEDKKGILKFFKDAKRIANSFESHKNISRTVDTKGHLESALHGLHMFKFILPFIPHVRYTGNKGVDKGLKKYFRSAKLRRVFSSEPDLLSCLIPISFAYQNDFQSPPEGGSQTYAEWLSFVIEQLGGDIFYNGDVKEILLENKRAKGLVFESKKQAYQLNSKYIIATNDLETLYNKQLPKDAISVKEKAKLDSAILYSSAFTVSLALDCKTQDLGLDEYSIYLADTRLVREDLDSGDPYKSGMHIIASSVRDATLALPNQGTLTLYIPAWIQQNNYWACEKDSKGNYIRGEAYKALKKQHADILIDRVSERLIPGLKEHILKCEIATPITHLRYTSNKNGTMMGQKPGKANMQAKVASYKTPIENLYRSGHWSDLGGGVPIAVKAALNTTLMVLKKEDKKVFNLLANYMDGKQEINSLTTSTLLKPYKNDWKLRPTPAQQWFAKKAKS